MAKINIKEASVFLRMLSFLVQFRRKVSVNWPDIRKTLTIGELLLWREVTAVLEVGMHEGVQKLAADPG